MQVRADHTARAVENCVYFVRGNNVSLGKEECVNKYDGVGYGDSYILDPWGEMMVRSRRHHEDFIFADIDPTVGRFCMGCQQVAVGVPVSSATSFGSSSIRRRSRNRVVSIMSLEVGWAFLPVKVQSDRNVQPTKLLGQTEY